MLKNARLKFFVPSNISFLLLVTEICFSSFFICEIFKVSGHYKNNNMANGTPSGTVMVVSDAKGWGEVVAFGFMVKEDESEVL